MVHAHRQSLLAVLLVAAFGLVLVGCSSQPEPDDMAASEAAMNEGMAGEAADSTGSGMQDAGSPIAEKTDAFVDAYLASANSLIARGEIQAAKQEVAKALALDGSDARALAKMAEIKGMLGEGTSDQDLADEVIRHKRLMRERQIAEVNNRYTKANQLYNVGEYAEALEELKAAELILEYDGYQTDFGGLKADVPAFKSEVERRLAETAAAREASEYENAYQRLRAEEERERAARLERIREMMLRGFEAFDRRDFDTSEDMAQRVLSEAPTYRQARDLLDFSRQARHTAWRENYYQTRREQMQRWKAQLRETQIPWHHLIQFPERNVWASLKEKRRNKGRVAAMAEESEAVSYLKNRLASETVNWEFTDITLSEAVQTIRDTQNVNVLISKLAREEKGEEPVDIRVRELNFADALKTMLEPLELTYTFKYDMIFIVGRTEASGDVYPEVYEVRDLTVQLPNFQGPDLSLRPGPAGEEAAGSIFGTEGEPTRDTEPEQLVDLVRDNVAPLSWDIEDRDLQLSSGQLIATTTADVHKEIEAFLDDLRQFTKVIVHVETRFISIREGFLNEVGVDIRGLGGTNIGQIATLDDVTNGNDDNASVGLDNGGVGGPGSAGGNPVAGAFFQDFNNLDFRARNENVFDRALGGFLSSTGGATIGFQFLDDVELGVIFRAVEKSAFANVLRAPRLAVYNNQRANLTLVNQVTYVKDYDVEVAQTANIADPLVDIIQDGLVLDVRPTVSHDRKYVTLELRPTVATLGRPIGTFVTSLAGNTQTVTIELPELQYRSAETTVKVPDGGSVVIGGLRSASTVDRRSEVPILSQIPILNFFFSRKGRSDEIGTIMVVLRVEIIDLEERERDLLR